MDGSTVVFNGAEYPAKNPRIEELPDDGSVQIASDGPPAPEGGTPDVNQLPVPPANDESSGKPLVNQRTVQHPPTAKGKERVEENLPTPDVKAFYESAKAGDKDSLDALVDIAKQSNADSLSDLDKTTIAEANFRLGSLYDRNEGAARGRFTSDKHQLIEDSYRKGAELGHAGAQINFSAIILDKKGVSEADQSTVKTLLDNLAQNDSLPENYKGRNVQPKV